MPTPKFKAHIENGLPVIDDSRLVEYCKKWDEGTVLDVIVKKPSKSISNPQLRYLYGVVYKMISDHTGHTIDEIDFLLKWKFLRRVGSRGIEYVPSKLDQTTIEAEDYARKCREWAAIAMELYIPLPNECEIPEYALVV